ncbi:MAG: replication-associated recombination protein A [Eubacteriaceae bacterium]|nr:replication-associated recombination protein A [Eubacteriaceae bacterium]
MRPETLDEFVGQSEILGEGKLLRRMLVADSIKSIVLFGPPGCGKTTLAKIISNTTQSYFETINATASGIADIRACIDNALKRMSSRNEKTIVFIDEIHRFNKIQQDALLPFIENGVITLIGATTENPFFELTPALASRTTIFTLKPLSAAEVGTIINNALTDAKKGVGGRGIVATEEAILALAAASDGDARVALNALELAALTTLPDSNGKINITFDVVSECIQKRIVKYDKGQDEHYNTISAFIKSIRGSDPDAALYWLAKMIYCGEDPKFIARRMVILASEDISNAQPSALTLAVATFNAVEVIGLPECQLNLAQCAVFLALSPKSSTSMDGLFAAMEDVKKMPRASVPAHLTISPSQEDKPEYKYPHNYPAGYVRQQYLPDALAGKKYYVPKEIGYEKRLADYLKSITLQSEMKGGANN